jgi:Fe-S cluster assembly protein SufD
MSVVNSIQDAYAALKGRLAVLPPSVLMRRDSAVLAAAGLGYPNTRSEDWKYTSLRPFLDKEFKVATRPPKTDVAIADLAEVQKRIIPGSIALIFVDGALSIGLSDTRKAAEFITIKTLFDAEASDEGLWKEVDLSSGLEHVFAQLAVGFAEYGVVIKVAPRNHTNHPIHIIHVTSPASEGISRSLRTVIEVQRLAEVSVFEEFVTIGAVASHMNSLTQILARERSYIGYYRMDHSSPTTFTTAQVTIGLDQEAKVETFSLAAGSRWSRINIDAVYNAPGGECILDGLYLTRGDQHVDHHTSVDHAEPDCHTRQMYKGILAGKSRAVFNGKIFIRRGATQSQAYQSNKNLLLSKDAEVDTKPELQIDNDDVKASHGAAIGAINPKELFYLQSRGIARVEAEAILSRGFADEVVMRLEDSAAREVLGDRVQRWFAEHTIED